MPSEMREFIGMRRWAGQEAPGLDSTCSWKIPSLFFTVLGMFFGFVVAWFCFFYWGSAKNMFLATIPRAEMFSLFGSPL